MHLPKLFLPKLIDVATRQVITLDESRSINDAVNVMAKGKMRDVIVEGGLGLRILSSRELMQFRLQNVSFHTPLNQVALNQVPTLGPDDSVLEGLQVIRQHPDGYLCLVDNTGALCGIVSATDLASCLDPHRIANSKTLAEVMLSVEYVKVKKSDTIRQALQAINIAHQTACLVFEDDQPIGIITQTDLIKWFDQGGDIEQNLAQIITSPLITIDINLTLEKALETLRQHSVKRLVVVDKTNNITHGLLHQKDIISLVYQDWSIQLLNDAKLWQTKQDLFSSGPLMVFEWLPSNDWPITYVSPNIQQVLGYSPASLMSGERAFAAIVHPDDLARLADEVAKFSAEKRPFWEQHYRLIDAQGKTHWVYDYTRPIYNQQGELETILGYLINQNDTDYNHQRFNNLVQNFPGMVYEFTLSPDGKMAFPYVSPGIIDLFELTPEEVQTSADPLIARFPEDVQSSLKQSIIESAQAMQPWTAEHHITLPSGKTRWLHAEDTPFKRKDGTIVSYGFAHDISDKKRLELAVIKSEYTMKLAQKLAKMGSWELDLVANTLYWSDEVFNIFRLDPQNFEPSYEAFLNLIHPEDKEAVNRAYQQSVTSKRAYQIDHRLLFADGKVKWVQERAQHQLNDQGEVIKSLGTIQDISEQKQYQTQTRITEEIFKQGHDGLMVCDTNARIVTVNQAFEKLTGYSAKDCLYQNPRFLQSGRHDKAFYQAFWDSLLNTGHWRGEIWNKSKSGEIYPQALSVSAIKDSQGQTINYLGIFHDITAQKQAEEQMMRLAFYDHLTGTANRMLLRERCEQLITRAERTPTLFSMIFIDLDYFKDVNDTHGHEIGDLVLIEASKRIQNLIRQQDTLARLGGDEFAILFPQLDADDSLELGKRLVTTLSEPYLIEGLTLSLSASMGIAVYPRDAQDYPTLLMHADQAMYQAKNNGRNNVIMYSAG